ncbi:LysR family transcriptional regulator [Vibrio brasiliensis]|jgi:LysR family glycine cleavage system transcriptional activator|uniref:LysR family transcriptional regulator n=1 Tax=Vibrio brasiliensis TaxID=170652 RepID=UPI001EFDF847|nr:LysR family transcriptional regulator [Vibrio brasiliensis]MCG9648635.1 LysR family transcriptional regulator [Vibrio brasiliensis]MCG9750509.1 LysR family transcriptional regulator [Vibrio brasiliensis]MCG9784119.1 LysR family transcriptional regulator [Vibrio brasiliensis]
MSAYSNLPYSHNALKVFEAVARWMSFTRAADELNVTQSAVSRQIKQLEQELSVSLLIRKHRSIELTEQGRDLYQVLSNNFHQLDSLIAQWKAPAKKRIVIKSALSYATRVLMPNVAMLNEKYPEHEIVIIPSIEEDPQLEAEDCDLLIINTRQKDRYLGKPGVTFLRAEYMAPVYAELLSDKSIQIEDVLRLPHLHATLDHQDWKLWIANADLQGKKLGRDTVFYSLDLALSACLSGQGVTVTDLLLVLPELKRKFLKCPEAIALQHSDWHYYCYQKNYTPIANEILQWLVSQTESEVAQLKQLCSKFSWSADKVDL